MSSTAPAPNARRRPVSRAKSLENFSHISEETEEELDLYGAPSSGEDEVVEQPPPQQRRPTHFRSGSSAFALPPPTGPNSRPTSFHQLPGPGPAPNLTFAAPAPPPQLQPPRASSSFHPSGHNPVLQNSADGSHHMALTPLGTNWTAGDFIDPRATPGGLAGPLARQPSSRPQSQELRRSGTDFDHRRSGSGTTQDLLEGGFRPRSLSAGGLDRSGTLLSHGAPAKQNERELKRLLGEEPLAAWQDGGRCVSGGADGNAKGGGGDARLEAGRRKARVEIDVCLERDVLVEGGDVRGRMEVNVRDWNKKEGDVHVGFGKVRIVGFEDLPSHNARHIFYHHSHCLPVFHPASLRQTSLFEYHGSQEPSPLLGYRLALAGSHSLSFDLPLPLSNFPRGPFRSSRGAIKYILIASLKLFFPATGKKSIAHFYRHITVYPFLEIDKVLLNYGDPIEVSRESKLGWKWAGGEGRVGLNVKAARKIWVAGQQCWIDVAIRNESSKKIKSLALSLYQITTYFHPDPTVAIPFSRGDHDAVQTMSRRKKVSESMLEAGQAGGRGYISGRGWWHGCEPGSSGSWGCGVLLPPDALSIPRGRLIEVSYVIRVSVNNAFHAELPIRIINFVSVDPPPSLQRAGSSRMAPSISNSLRASDKSIYDNDLGTARTRAPPKSLSRAPADQDRLRKAKSLGSLRAQAMAPQMTQESSASQDEERGLLAHRTSMAFLRSTIDAAAADEEDGLGRQHDEYSDDEGEERDDEVEGGEATVDGFSDDRHSIGDANSARMEVHLDQERFLSTGSDEDLDEDLGSLGIGQTMQNLVIASDSESDRDDGEDEREDDVRPRSPQWSFDVGSHHAAGSPGTRSPLVRGISSETAASEESRAAPALEDGRSVVQSDDTSAFEFESPARDLGDTLPTVEDPPHVFEELVPAPMRRPSSVSSPSSFNRHSVIDQTRLDMRRPSLIIGLERRDSVQVSHSPGPSLPISPEPVHLDHTSPSASRSSPVAVFSPSLDSSPPLSPTTTPKASPLAVQEADARSASPTKRGSAASLAVPQASSLSKKQSFSFATAGAPIKVKPVLTTSAPVRVRATKSMSNLRASSRSPAPPLPPLPTSPQRVRDTSAALLCSPKKVSSPLHSAQTFGGATSERFKTSRNGRISPSTPSPFLSGPSSRPSTPRIVLNADQTPASPHARSSSRLAADRSGSSSDSGSASETTTPPPSAISHFPAASPKHLARAMPPSPRGSVSSIKSYHGPPPPRSYSLDVDAFGPSPRASGTFGSSGGRLPPSASPSSFSSLSGYPSHRTAAPSSPVKTLKQKFESSSSPYPDASTTPRGSPSVTRTKSMASVGGRKGHSAQDSIESVDGMLAAPLMLRGDSHLSFKSPILRD